MTRSPQDDPYHPIVARPWEYEIIELCYSVDPSDQLGARLDLTLHREGDVRRLRFLGVQNLSVEDGFPVRTSGLCIIDVSRRQLDGLKIHVDDFEASFGKVRLWARDVVDRDTPEDSSAPQVDPH